MTREPNIERLLRIRDQVLAEPAVFDMTDYVIVSDCGTTLCFGARAALDAGFITLRETPRPGARCTFYEITPSGALHGSEMRDLAMAALSINEKQAKRLFHLEHWPSAFWTPFLRAKTTQDRATIAAKRIEHFIRTEGAE